jgi:hypothetical protein
MFQHNFIGNFQNYALTGLIERGNLNFSAQNNDKNCEFTNLSL